MDIDRINNVSKNFPTKITDITLTEKQGNLPEGKGLSHIGIYYDPEWTNPSLRIVVAKQTSNLKDSDVSLTKLEIYPKDPNTGSQKIALTVITKNESYITLNWKEPGYPSSGSINSVFNGDTYLYPIIITRDGFTFRPTSMPKTDDTKAFEIKATELLSEGLELVLEIFSQLDQLK